MSYEEEATAPELPKEAGGVPPWRVREILQADCREIADQPSSCRAALKAACCHARMLGSYDAYSIPRTYLALHSEKVLTL